MIPPWKEWESARTHMALVRAKNVSGRRAPPSPTRLALRSAWGYYVLVLLAGCVGAAVYVHDLYIIIR